MAVKRERKKPAEIDQRDAKIAQLENELASSKAENTRIAEQTAQVNADMQALVEVLIESGVL